MLRKLWAPIIRRIIQINLLYNMMREPGRFLTATVIIAPAMWWMASGDFNTVCVGLIYYMTILLLRVVADRRWSGGDK